MPTPWTRSSGEVQDAATLHLAVLKNAILKAERNLTNADELPKAKEVYERRQAEWDAGLRDADQR